MRRHDAFWRGGDIAARIAGKDNARCGRHWLVCDHGVGGRGVLAGHVRLVQRLRYIDGGDRIDPFQRCAAGRCGNAGRALIDAGGGIDAVRFVRGQHPPGGGAHDGRWGHYGRHILWHNGRGGGFRRLRDLGRRGVSFLCGGDRCLRRDICLRRRFALRKISGKRVVEGRLLCRGCDLRFGIRAGEPACHGAAWQRQGPQSHQQQHQEQDCSQDQPEESRFTAFLDASFCRLRCGLRLRCRAVVDDLHAGLGRDGGCKCGHRLFCTPICGHRGGGFFAAGEQRLLRGGGGHAIGHGCGFDGRRGACCRMGDTRGVRCGARALRQGCFAWRAACGQSCRDCVVGRLG